MALTPGTSPEDLAMGRYSRGDDAAFSELYDCLAPRLFGFLRRHAGVPGLADDLLQQTFMHLHRARGSFVAGAAVLPWAFAIARRLALDAARHRRRHASESAGSLDDVAPPEASPDSSPEELLAAEETAECVRDTLAHLPETQRVAFDLVKRQGLTFQEAAAVLGVTVAAAKLRAQRAYDALHAALDGRDVEGRH